MDSLDARLLDLLAAEPRIGVLEASRRLGVARGTVQARLDRLEAAGVVRGFGPDVDPAALGYPVTAFVTLEIRQPRGHDPLAARLSAIPEVLEVHTITGSGDMLCRVVARSNADLQRVIDAIVDVEGVERTSTVIALATLVPYRAQPLVGVAADPGTERLSRPAASGQAAEAARPRSRNAPTISATPSTISQMPTTSVSAHSDGPGYISTTRPATIPRMPIVIPHPRPGIPFAAIASKSWEKPRRIHAKPMSRTRIATEWAMLRNAIEAQQERQEAGDPDQPAEPAVSSLAANALTIWKMPLTSR